MASEYDQEQDRRIAANTDAIVQMTQYLQDMRNHFEPIFAMADKVPAAWRMRVRKLRVLVKMSILVVILGKVGIWYFNKQKLHQMADRYAQVATKLYYEENNAEVALPFLEKALSIDKECPDYLFTRAYMQGMAATRMLSNLKRPYTKAELDLAHRSYAEALYLEEIEPKKPETYILQAQILTVLKDVSRAKEAIAHAIELDPRNDFAYIRRAMIQLDCENDIAGAEESLAIAEKLNPKSKWMWLWKGILAMDFKSDPVVARACYEKALAIDSKFDLAHYNLAWTFVSGSQKDYAAAREEMKKALQVNPDYKEAFYAMGMFYGYEDNYAVAKIWMDKAILIDDKFLPAHLWRGIICGEMGDYTEAIASFDKAILLDPMNFDLYVRRSRMYARIGRSVEALRDLRFAYEMNPNSLKTLLYLGDAYLQMDDKVNAMKYYDAAISVDATNDDAYARRAKVLDLDGKKDEALASLDSAIRVTRYKPARFWIQKGELLKKYERMNEALVCYVQARTLDPKSSVAWRQEALLVKEHDPNAYRNAMEHYLELNPTDSSARNEQMP